MTIIAANYIFLPLDNIVLETYCERGGLRIDINNSKLWWVREVRPSANMNGFIEEFVVKQLVKLHDYKNVKP